MNKKRIRKKLNRLIDKIEFFTFDLCSLRNKTSLASDIDDLTLLINGCAEASHALRNARGPNSNPPLYIPDRGDPGAEKLPLYIRDRRAPGAEPDFNRPLNDREIEDILLTRYQLLSLYYRAKRGEEFGAYSILQACKEIDLPETLKIPTTLTGDALITHLLDLINYTSKILYSEIKGE